MSRAALNRFTLLPVKLPKTFEKALGYAGSRRYVAFYWEPYGDEAVYDDGICSGDGNWHGFLSLVDHPRLARLLSTYNLGGSEEEAGHWLLADLEERELYVGPRDEVHHFVIEHTRGAAPLVFEGSQAVIAPESFSEIAQKVLAELRAAPPLSIDEVEKRIREDEKAVRDMVAEL